MTASVELTAPPQDIAEAINFTDENTVQKLRFAPSLGFLAIAGEQGGIHVVSFHSTVEDQDQLTPLASLRDRPRDAWHIDRNAKGWGIIGGNTPQSVTFPSDTERSMRYHGVWITPELFSDDLINVRKQFLPAAATSLIGIGRHLFLRNLSQASRIFNRLMGVDVDEAKIRGVETAMRFVERRYGKAILAAIDPAPTWLANQRLYSVRHPITPVWAVYRDPQRRPLIRIGTVRLPQVQAETGSDNEHRITRLPDQLAATRSLV